MEDSQSIHIASPKIVSPIKHVDDSNLKSKERVFNKKIVKTKIFGKFSMYKNKKKENSEV